MIPRFIGDRIAFSPPLIITEAEIDTAFTRIAQAMDDSCAELGIGGQIT